jgi:hypothetical protein
VVIPATWEGHQREENSTRICDSDNRCQLSLGNHWTVKSCKIIFIWSVDDYNHLYGVYNGTRHHHVCVSATLQLIHTMSFPRNVNKLHTYAIPSRGGPHKMFQGVAQRDCSTKSCGLGMDLEDGFRLKTDSCKPFHSSNLAWSRTADNCKILHQWHYLCEHNTEANWETQVLRMTIWLRNEKDTDLISHITQ